VYNPAVRPAGPPPIIAQSKIFDILFPINH
jgi:hypothetical protein